jgi:hypothetical protein
MVIIFEMSTDADIVGTALHPDWGADIRRFNWQEVSNGGHHVSDGEVIVVIAHGNNQQIGNTSDDPSIGPARFVALVQANLSPDATPSAIYISTCGQNIASYTAGVRISAEKSQLLGGTRLLGHDSPVAGVVPPPDLEGSTWVEIFESRTRG